MIEGSIGDMVLVSHLISQEHLINRHAALWVGVSHDRLPTFQFGDHGHCGSGYIVFLLCRVILRDHVIRG